MNEGGAECKGGRLCWNLFPPTDNYRAVSLPVTTAVPGLPVGRPRLKTQIQPPHTHPARMLFLEEWGFICSTHFIQTSLYFWAL